MKYKQKLFLILFLTGSIGLSNVGRHDIEWFTNYEDFAMNKGKYSIGKENVIVYRKDGTVSGKIEQPIPNFDGVVDPGYFALWGDSQILTGVTHVGHPDNFTFSKRHIRDDVELYSGYKLLSKDKKYEKFSENIGAYYRLNIGRDYSLVRTNKVAFDAHAHEAITQNDWNRIKDNDLLARIGGGVNVIAVDNKKEEWAVPYGHIAGGLNKVKSKWQTGNQGIDKVIYLMIEKTPKTPLDSGTKPGDSGSPLFWWDSVNKKWLIASSNTGGSNAGYTKSSQLLSNAPIFEKWKNLINDDEITGNNVFFENGVLRVGNQNRSFDDREERRIENNRITSHVITQDGTINEKMFKVKNQIFNSPNLSVNVIGNTDTGSARLEFKNNTTLKGNGNLLTAGLLVHKNAVLNYELNFRKNNIVRKIGEGKLVIKSTGNNGGDLNLGGGETVLENTGGYAAANIRLAQGAKLTINRADQLNGDNVIFGHRGGTLNVNGVNLGFRDIYHMDKDAKIANESTSKSTVTFNPSSGERVFLGSFKNNLDIKYNPGENNSIWSVRSKDTDIKGNFDIEKGSVKIEGDTVVHGYKNTVYEDEFEEAKFKAANIDIKNTSKLEINRAAKVETTINVKDNSVLEVNALGTVKDMPTPYDGARTEKEINDVVVKGIINFNSSATNNFKSNVENNNEARIEAEIKGNIKAVKEGSGLLHLKNNQNSSLNGNFEVNGGKIKASTEGTLGNTITKLNNHSILEVENNEDLDTLLDRIDKSSEGVLSLGQNINNISTKLNGYSSLFLGSSKNITIGDENTAINANINTLNLGGDNGTLTLKGLNNSTTVTKLNIGDGVNRGTVIVDRIGANNTNLDIDVKNGVNLIINHHDNNAKNIKLGYGSSLDQIYRFNLKDESEGVLYVDPNASLGENNRYTALGTAKGNEVRLYNYNGGNNNYHFSGEGKLNIDMVLDNKDLVVDGQYFEGGVVELKRNSDTYTGNITVMGNKNGENKGNITLVLGSEKPLGENNKLLVKDGGIVDLNSKNLTVKIDANNNQYGTIKNSQNPYSTLTINTDTTDLALNNKLVGNINLVKLGSSSLELTNEENEFNKDTKGDILVKEGKLNYYNSNAYRNTKIKIEDNTILNTRTEQVTSEITANGGKIKVDTPLTPAVGDKNTTFAKIVMQKNLVVDGAANDITKKVIYNDVALNGNNITFNNQFVSWANFTGDGNNKGEAEFNNSTYYLNGGNHKGLSNPNVSKIKLNDSEIRVRDYNNEVKDKNSDKLTNIEISGNSVIRNGIRNVDNGGGAKSDFNNPITIKEDATLTLSVNNQFGNDFTIDSKIKGEGKIKLEQTSSGTINITDNFKEFTGTMEAAAGSKDRQFKFNINAENEEDRVLGYKFIDGKYVNKSDKALGFKNIKDFTGEIHGNMGDILLIDKDAITTNGKILLSQDKNVIMRISEDSVMSNMNVEGVANGNSKIIKQGNFDLRVNDITTKNISTTDITEGTLTIAKDIFSKYGSSYNLSENTKLIADFANDGNINSNITGEGDFVQNGSKVSINSTLLKHTGNIELNSELDLKLLNMLDTNTVLNQNLVGNENGKLNVIDSLADLGGDTSELEINKDLSKFKGTINLVNANLALNIQDAVVDTKITGDMPVYNKNESELTLNNIEKFSGTVESRNGDIKLNVDEDIKVSKYVIGNGDIKINNTVDLNLSNKRFENNGDKSLVKLGDAKLSLSSNSIENIKKVSVDEGTLSLVDNKNGDKINGSLNIKENANVDFVDGTYINEVENAGNIVLDNKDLKINNYTSNGGKFDITLNEMNKKLLEIENTSGDVNASLNVGNSIINDIVDNHKKLNIAKVPNNINLVNIKDYDSVYELNLEKDADNIVKLYSLIKPDVLNNLYVFNELDLVNGINNELKYRNLIEANFVNYNKIDKNYLNMNNTEYKNKTATNGLEVNFETAHDVKNVKLSGGLNFNVLGSNLTTSIKGKDDVSSNFVSISAVPTIGVKYKFFDVNFGLGANTVLINNEKNKDTLVYLNNSLNVGINPVFKVTDDLSIRYLNKVGYKATPMLSETISKNSGNKYKISHNSPFSVFYETGIKLEHKYVDFFTKANMEYNLSSYDISSRDKKISNDFKDDWRINVKTGFEFKPTEKVYINLDFDANVYQKSYGKYIFKLGTGYNW
ncbi:S6 family peptidase [Streptobacillus felis]|uniref:S6 family peptidase n=1 Tax=Streptobacillus felis TaxID=1384509 RepID=UPI0008309232|nr:S6 family peptidase [Streptobacillus felis]